MIRSSGKLYSVSEYEYDNNGNMVRYRIISKEESNMNTMNMGI